MRVFVTFLTGALIMSLILIAIPDNSYAQVGCCRTVDESPVVPAGECVGCEGGSCFTTADFCTEEGGFFNTGRLCVSTDNGAACRVDRTDPGCCVISQGICIEDSDDVSCFEAGGVLQISGGICSEISRCERIPRNVPTLSQWGLIALAGALGILGFIIVIRRKAEA